MSCARFSTATTSIEEGSGGMGGRTIGLDVHRDFGDCRLLVREGRSLAAG